MRDSSKTGLPTASRRRRQGGKSGPPGHRTQSSFHLNVLNVVKSIPAGRTLSYKEVAKKAGKPLAFRAVGSILKRNYDSAVPCHRVIRSDGTTGFYNKGAEEKIRILKKEGAL